MNRLTLLAAFILLWALAGCGGSGSSSTATATPAGAKTYFSVVQQSNVTTQLKHIVFFNTTTLFNYLGRDVPKGTVLDQAFVDDALLAVPVNDNRTDVVVCEPVDPAVTSVTKLNGRYVVANTTTGTIQGSYSSARTRTNNESGVTFLTFNMLSNNFAVYVTPASMMYLNLNDYGAVLAPPDSDLPGYGVASGHWKIDPVTGKLYAATP